MSNREEVYDALDEERAYQDSLSVKIYGVPDAVNGKLPEQYVLFMQDYLEEARKQLSRTWGTEAYAKALDTIRKVTALGVACMEVNGVVRRVKS